MSEAATDQWVLVEDGPQGQGILSENVPGGDSIWVPKNERQAVAMALLGGLTDALVERVALAEYRSVCLQAGPRSWEKLPTELPDGEDRAFWMDLGRQRAEAAWKLLFGAGEP